MDGLLAFSSDSQALHMELLRLEAPSVIMPCAASNSRQSCHRRVLRPNLVDNPSYVELGGFEA
jgi:hypothetical protein